MRIFKFGGASVQHAEGVKNLGQIAQKYLDQPLVIVVSAMGKSTNALEILADLAYKRQPFEDFLLRFAEEHRAICMDLFSAVPDEISNWLIQLTRELENSDTLTYAEFYDRVVPYGELIATSIVANYFGEHIARCAWLDARKYIKTNSRFTEAGVEWQLTERFISRDLPDLLENGPVITQGFIGSDLTGKPTTLGREGSDFTGAIFAHCLSAESLTVWKDVAGLLNADPKRFPSAELFDELSFQEVTELTYYGAKVIHPKTIRPLAQRNIPLYVRSFINPEGKGTKISEHEKFGNMPCYVFKENQLLVSLRVKDNSFMDERKLGQIFQSMDHVNIKINMMHNSALTFTFCMDHSEAKLENLRNYLQHDFQVLYNEGLELATIKNYTMESFKLLPPLGELILEQRTRNNYQVVYRPEGIKSVD